MSTNEFVTLYSRELNDENVLLVRILQGTTNETGEDFFRVLVRELASVLGTYGALVADYASEAGQLIPRAYWLGNDWVKPAPYDIAGTPCEGVIRRGTLFQIPDRVIEHYPQNEFLQTYNLASYTGMAFKDADGEIVGHLAVLDTKPVPDEARFMALFEIFGNRAAAEMRRIRAEDELREREERLRCLIDGALDAIIDFDDELAIRFANQSALLLFDRKDTDGLRASMKDWFVDDSIRVLRGVMTEISAKPEGRQAWIGNRLKGVRGDGRIFDAEATLSQATGRASSSYTLILRDIHALRDAEQRIRQLQRQADLMRGELAVLQQPGRIVGDSPVFRTALAKAEQVATTDASVLLLGETGTGKEVIARAIHDSSRRRDKPLIVVNCAAIPHELVESEFFGHVKGAFTGATAHRDGRFSRADGGTIFLDEVGELPLGTQAKLLRVLQEGEFDPVGGSHTRKVDVRIIAATNRDIAAAVRQGQFREDLYYRLSVFPIEIPPLRERGDDILLLAEFFAESAADRIGRPRKPLDPDSAARLLTYRWPGNVRELQNIIEHSIITSHADRLFPEVAGGTTEHVEPIDVASDARRILTMDELRSLQGANIARALEACDGRISGEHGAALMLGINPSTLRSQMKTLGIDGSPR